MTAIYPDSHQRLFITLGSERYFCSLPAPRSESYRYGQSAREREIFFVKGFIGKFPGAVTRGFRCQRQGTGVVLTGNGVVAVSVCHQNCFSLLETLYSGFMHMTPSPRRVSFDGSGSVFS